MALLGRNAAIQKRQFHVFQGRRARQEIEPLKDEAQELAPQESALVARELFDVQALEEVLAARGAVERADDVHHRRLARARGAHDRHELALIDREVDVGERVEGRLARTVALADVAQFNEPFGHRTYSFIRKCLGSPIGGYLALWRN